MQQKVARHANKWNVTGASAMVTHAAAIFEIQLRGCEDPPIFQVGNPMLGGGRVQNHKSRNLEFWTSQDKKSNITQPLSLPLPMPKNTQKSTHPSPQVLDMLHSVS